MKPAVRQMRGPGMNKGLKKPRHGTIKQPPKPSSTSRSAEPQSSSGERKDYSKSSSYLSKTVWK